MVGLARSVSNVEALEDFMHKAKMRRLSTHSRAHSSWSSAFRNVGRDSRESRESRDSLKSKVSADFAAELASRCADLQDFVLSNLAQAAEAQGGAAAGGGNALDGSWESFHVPTPLHTKKPWAVKGRIPKFGDTSSDEVNAIGSGPSVSVASGESLTLSCPGSPRAGPGDKPALPEEIVEVQFESHESTFDAAYATTGTSHNSVMVTSASKRQQRLARVIADVSEMEIAIEEASLRRRVVIWLMPAVELISGIFIIMNCITIGVSLDVDPDWAGWASFDIMFAVVFAIEILLKIWLQGQGYFLSSNRGWNFFETGLVALSIFELVVLASLDSTKAKGGATFSILRLLRLGKIVRLFRLCRIPFFTELVTMVQSAMGGSQTLCWATVLMCMPLYAASILFRATLGLQAAEGNVAMHFETVPVAFFTLFRCIMSQECTDEQGRPIFWHVAQYHGWGYSFGYCFLELFMVLGLFNVVVGFFIERVLAGARRNEKLMQRERLLDKVYFANKMVELAGRLYRQIKNMEGVPWSMPAPHLVMEECLDMDFTEEVLERTFNTPEARRIFEDLNIAQEDTIHLVHLLDIDGNGIVDLAELIEGISSLRGTPCRSDLVMLKMTVEQRFEQLRGQLGISKLQQAQSLAPAQAMMTPPSPLDLAPAPVPPRWREGSVRVEFQHTLANESFEESAEGDRRKSPTESLIFV